MNHEPIRVLHVDDHPEFLELVSIFLEREDERFTVIPAKSADEAISTFHASRVDCIVSDYDMPDRNGIELLSTIRGLDSTIPFILYTGKGSEEIASKAISAGVTDYLQKGTGSDQYTLLANRIENAVEQARANRRATELGRINTVIRETNEALVQATDPEEIDRHVCEILTRAEPYTVACIGTVDLDTGEFIVRAAAGADKGSLESITLTANGDRTQQGSAARALTEDRVVVKQNIQEEDVVHWWQTAPNDRVYRAVAVVPLTYEASEYGILCVYSDRPAAFDEEEQSLLVELGDTIAHAHHRVEVQHLYEDQYRTLFEEAPVMFCITTEVDGKPIIEDCNREFANRLGYPRNELRDRPLAELYAERSAYELLEGGGYARAITGEFMREHRTLVTVDGEPVETLLRATPRRDRSGAIVGTQALFVDITDERRLDELVRIRERMEVALDRTESIVFEMDFNSETVSRHGNFETVFGFPSEQIPTWRDFAETVVHPDDRAAFEHLHESLADGAATTGEIEYRTHPDAGEVRWMRSEIYANTTDDGRREGIGLVRDVTDRKRRERELTRTNAILSTLFDTLPVGVLAEDENREVIAVNRRLLDLFELGNDPTDVLGSDCRECAEQVANAFVESGKFIEEIEEIIADRRSVDADELTLTDGRTFTRSHRPIELPEGMGHLWVYRDISTRKEHERQLERQTERLEEFASVVSHDLRNPLTVAEGQLELARTDCRSEHLDAVERALSRMNALIEDILELARETDPSLTLMPVPLTDVIHECWTNVETADATLELQAERTILADESRLKRLFENLIRNAIEHGGADVSLFVGDCPNGVFVEDTGPGIPPDARERIFDDGYTTTDRGTGFGLGIVREIVNSHGWRIDVTEGTAGGARFEITGVEFVEP